MPKSFFSTGTTLALGFALLAAGCGPSVGHATNGEPTPKDMAQPAATQCEDGDRRCAGSSHQSCDHGRWADDATCPAACDTTLGCVPCAPGQRYCDGDAVRDC